MGPPVKVIVIGGSIGGLSCAHALRNVGCDVQVFERAPSITEAGAGLGLDEETCAILEGFGLKNDLREVSLAMPVENNAAINDDRDRVVLLEDDSYKHKSTHWSDIHGALYRAIPEGIVHYAHEVTAFEQLQGGPVRVTISSGKDGQTHTEHHECDLLVAADGSGSKSRQKFAPTEQRRYSGYCAWRGVLKADEQPEVAEVVRKRYPELGRCLYFDIARGTHSVLYELPKHRLNWLWYVNQPEPELKGPSVTVKADEGKIKEMHTSAEETWTPQMTQLMKATQHPFINAIFDKQPLDRFVWGRTVLVGEAAHPTTPHGLRSTNMAICDAGQLAKSIASHPDDLEEALEEYQRIRVPRTSQEVLFSRHLGQLKQALVATPDWIEATEEQRHMLAQANMKGFDWKGYQLVFAGVDSNSLSPKHTYHC